MDDVLSTMSVNHCIRAFVYGDIAIDPMWFELIDDLREADRLSTQQDIWASGYDYWNGVKQIAIAKANIPRVPVAPNHREIRKYLLNYYGVMETVLEQAILSNWVGDRRPRTLGSLSRMARTIAADIFHICLSRVQHGITGEPFESMFSAYKQGGWPCGWRGDYPLGKMVVYHVGPKL